MGWGGREKERQVLGPISSFKYKKCCCYVLGRVKGVIKQECLFMENEEPIMNLQ